jgi:predicted transcriptional regulator
MTVINTLPEWCLSVPHFSANTKILLFFFLYSVNLRMRVSAGRLVARTHFARESFRRSVNQLVAAGIVTRHAREFKNYGYVYELNAGRLVELGAPNVSEFFKGYKHGLETKN